MLVIAAGQREQWMASTNHAINAIGSLSQLNDMQQAQCSVGWVQLHMCLGYSCMPHAHPRASSWAVVSPFMVPCVPTGMKTGSSTCMQRGKKEVSLVSE